MSGLENGFENARGAGRSETGVPLVSVCCLAYDQEKYIRRTLDGFLMQRTSFPFEILVHDDASTDGTADVIREYEREHPGLIFPIFQKENMWSKGGNPGEINRRRARGKYLAYCEGDDFWTDPGKLEKQVAYMEAHPECGLVYTDVDTCDETGRTLRKGLFGGDGGTSDLFFEGLLVDRPFLAPCTWLFRKRLTEDYRSRPGCPVGDLPLLLWISRVSEVRFLPGSTAVYRISRKSVSRPPTFDAVFAFHRGIFDLQRSTAEESARGRAVLPRLMEKFYSYWFPAACLYAERGFADEARRFLEERGRLTPFRRFYHYVTGRPAGLAVMRAGAGMVYSKLRPVGRFLRKF